MIENVYSIKDKLVGFLTPNCIQSDEVAIRVFTNMVNGNAGLVPASDFDLYVIGSFDTETGLLSPLTIPKIVITGREVFKSHEV